VLFICVFLPFSGYLFIFRRWSQFSIPNHAATAAAITTTATAVPAAATAACDVWALANWGPHFFVFISF